MNPNFLNLYLNSSNAGYPSYQRTSSSSHRFLRSESTSNQSFSYFNQRFPNPSPSAPFRRTDFSRSESSRTPQQPFRRQTLYDPNYSLTSATTSTEKSAVIMCVTEGTGHSKGTIGVAAIDLYRPELELSQFTDDSNYESLRNKCIGYQPSVFLIPNTFFKDNNRLLEVMSNQLEGLFIKDIDRKSFNECEGSELIHKLRCEDCATIDIQLKGKYYCLAAAGALLKYLETTERLTYAPKSLRVQFKSADNTMTIDSTTAKLLELVVNLNDPKSSESLLGTINRTKTRSGHRLLRSNLLQPFTDMKLIECRLDMIEAIVSSQALFDDLGSLLNQFSGIEIERVISCLVQTYKNPEPNMKAAERKIECILVLKHILSLIGPVVDTLVLCESKVFNGYLEVLSDQRFLLIVNAINEFISEDCNYSKSGHKMKLEKCSALKKGLNALLDIARDAYSESIDDIYNIIKGYSQECKELLTIKSVYTSSRGYHMEIDSKKADKRDFQFPKEFIKMVFNKKTINFTTQELINKNNRINSAVEEIYLMSDSIITLLIENVRQSVGCLYNLAEVVSKLDVVYSLASQCALGNYVRPQFSDYIAIKQGTHPILEKVLNQKPVPNDIFLSEDNNFLVITGPNMSGKSTLLKQLALHQVMAQIGSFIPAEFAMFRIFDKIFSRIGNNDEIETNSSTFMVEMREMSYILKNLSDSSLVIIDELGRGTSVEEGVGICFAICEHLLQTNAFSLLATHFIELTKLENFYLNVSNYYFDVKHENEGQEGETYEFTHVLESGVTKESFYGLRMANSTAMNPKILAKAQEFAITLNNIQNPALISEGFTEIDRILYKLASVLKTLLTEGTDVETLAELQIKYRNEIEASIHGTDVEMSEPINDFSLV